VGLGAILVLGVLDQTTRGMVPDYEALARIYRADAEYVARVEATLPPRSMVFQLPMTQFPEEPASGRIKAYEAMRPYLHSRTLRWSFPTVKGRYGSAWQEGAAELPPASMAEWLAYAGFGGIYIDRAGYGDEGAALEAELSRTLGVTPIVSDNRRYAFFNMGTYADGLTRGLDPAELASRRDAALNPVVASWKRGFYAREPGLDGHSWRWCDGYGELILTNPSSRPRRVELKMALETLPWSPMAVCVEHPGGAKAYTVDGRGLEVNETLIVGPGETTLRLGSNGVTTTAPGDTRTLAFRVARLTLSDPDVTGGLATAAKPSTRK
jgi:phosphoglycerol transferase